MPMIRCLPALAALALLGFGAPALAQESLPPRVPPAPVPALTLGVAPGPPIDSLFLADKPAVVVLTDEPQKPVQVTVTSKEGRVLAALPRRCRFPRSSRPIRRSSWRRRTTS